MEKKEYTWPDEAVMPVLGGEHAQRWRCKVRQKLSQWLMLPSGLECKRMDSNGFFMLIVTGMEAGTWLIVKWMYVILCFET